MKYLVRVSQLRYGTVEVEAKNEEEAKILAAGMEVDYFDEEITDMLVEKVEPDEVNWLEKETLKIMQKTIDGVMEMEVDSIVYRLALEELSDCTYLIDNGFWAGAILKIHGTTTSSALYDVLDKYLERGREDGKEV